MCSGSKYDTTLPTCVLNDSTKSPLQCYFEGAKSLCALNHAVIYVAVCNGKRMMYWTPCLVYLQITIA